MTMKQTNTLTPWIVALGAITLVASVACGVTDGEEPDENNITTMPGEDMGGGGGGGMDQGGGGGSDDMGGGGGGDDMDNPDPVDQGTDPVDQGTDPVDMGTDPVDMNVDPPAGGWTVYSHPCAGNRTDALFCDDDQTCYTGCGTTTTGRGMFVTTDGGVNWDTVDTTPEDIFNGSRVNDIWRSPDDGKLYVAGDLPNGFGVLSMEPDGTLGEVFKRGNKVGFGFTPGSFRRGSSGKAIVESLTGVDLLYRDMDSTDAAGSWSEGTVTAASGGGGRVQLLAMDSVGDDIYGCGSRIIEPPRVLVPAWDDEFGMQAVEMSEPGSLGAFAGELWDIDVDANGGVIAGGVNQSSAIGIVYTFNPGDSLAPSDRANWSEFKVSRIFDGKATWVQGVCREGDIMYAVGRESREGWGFVLRSQDAGATWEDISPYDAGSSKSSLDEMYRCHVTSTGGVIAAGAGGSFVVYED